MAMKFVKPQLARKWTKRRDENLIDTPGYTMEPKLDGHRCAIVVTTKQVILISRQGNVMQPNKWLETWVRRHIHPGTYIDGELVSANRGDSSHNVGSLRARNPDQLAFVAFDVLYVGGKDIQHKGWNFRRRMLEMLTELAHPWPLDGQLEPGNFYIIESRRWSDTTPAIGRAATRDAWLKQGFEGVVFKDMFSQYKPNSRSTWIKWKWSMKTDVIIVSCDARPSEWRVRPGHRGTDGVLYPEGRHTDPWLAGHVGLEYGFGPVSQIPGTHAKRLLNVPGVGLCMIAGSLGVTGPEEEMEKYVGQVARVKCWGAYDSGALRHPQPLEYREYKVGAIFPPPKPTLETIDD